MSLTTFLAQSSAPAFQTNDVALVVLVCGVAACTAVVLTVVSQRHKLRMKRLEVLRAALEQGDRDSALRDEVLRVLSGEHRFGLLALLRSLLRPQLWQRIAFGGGWFMFVISGGFALMGLFEILRVQAHDVVPYMLIGLALMTLPHGLRELLRRERAALEQR